MSTYLMFKNLNIKLNNEIILIFDYFVTLLIILRDQQTVFFVSSSNRKHRKLPCSNIFQP